MYQWIIDGQMNGSIDQWMNRSMEQYNQSMDESMNELRDTERWNPHRDTTLTNIFTG